VPESTAAETLDSLPSAEEWGDALPQVAAEPHRHPPDAPSDAVPINLEDLADDDGEPFESDATRRMLDENLLTILREEAEREARARRAEGRGLETQPDLGLEQIPAALAARAAAVAPPPEAPATETSARLRPDTTDAEPANGARRDRLPDIEVINSTLRATSERGSAPASRDAPESRARKRAGFRLGFMSVVLLAAVAVALYAFAPSISSRLPTLEPALSQYVAWVDAGRVWLDQQMRAVTERLQADS